MGDIDVVHRDPEQARRNFAHQSARDVDGKFVGARQRKGVDFEIIDRELQQILELLQFEFVAHKLRSVIRSFVVVAEQVL